MERNISFEEFFEGMLGRKLYAHELVLVEYVTGKPDNVIDKLNKPITGQLKREYNSIKKAKEFYENCDSRLLCAIAKKEDY